MLRLGYVSVEVFAVFLINITSGFFLSSLVSGVFELKLGLWVLHFACFVSFAAWSVSAWFWSKTLEKLWRQSGEP